MYIIFDGKDVDLDGHQKYFLEYPLVKSGLLK
ncbi:hypothetical protein CKC_04860 [Candidatus Liberibacter solanacearum CLso-ZC1]|uniref:Uncharacterized protein n=1 Tax=Liberibacter solanacearum (strain CLso-ZC1) TaxID=658172 RepID=E4UDP3_LIBSC|nr:hypothetical protein CKC_04860 [Candidatus Liberibacter solanacearum CLso-ZC1]